MLENSTALIEHALAFAEKGVVCNPDQYSHRMADGGKRLIRLGIIPYSLCPSYFDSKSAMNATRFEVVVV